MYCFAYLIICLTADWPSFSWFYSSCNSGCYRTRGRTCGGPQELCITKCMCIQWFAMKLDKLWGFPGGTVINNLPANARDARDSGSIPGLGRSPGGRNGNPLQNSYLENFMERGSWQATVHGVAKSQTQLSMHALYINYIIYNKLYHVMSYYISWKHQDLWCPALEEACISRYKSHYGFWGSLIPYHWSWTLSTRATTWCANICLEYPSITKHHFPSFQQFVPN